MIFILIFHHFKDLCNKIFTAFTEYKLKEDLFKGLIVGETFRVIVDTVFLEEKKKCTVPSGYYKKWFSVHGWRLCAFNDGRFQLYNAYHKTFILLIITVKFIIIKHQMLF